jgi:hypothetical protein
MTTHPDHSRAETQADFWHPTGHCCIEAKSVLAIHQAGSQDPSGDLGNPDKPDI